MIHGSEKSLRSPPRNYAPNQLSALTLHQFNNIWPPKQFKEVSPHLQQIAKTYLQGEAKRANVMSCKNLRV